MSDPLLSTLCSICHINAHKYRCPRCFTLTCSLPCIKRHKKWAQCNGVRDPGAYIKQKDLATAKGIDHDYNYLTSLEREIDRAEKDASLRGIFPGGEVRPEGWSRSKGDNNLQKAWKERGVIVVKAPKGMSRNNQNTTRFARGARILTWTVEWVHPDGTRGLSKCLENKSISKAYATYLDSLDHRSPKRRKANPRSSDEANLKVQGDPGDGEEDTSRHNKNLSPPQEIPSGTNTSGAQELLEATFGSEPLHSLEKPRHNSTSKPVTTDAKTVQEDHAATTNLDSKESPDTLPGTSTEVPPTENTPVISEIKGPGTGLDWEVLPENVSDNPTYPVGHQQKRKASHESHPMSQVAPTNQRQIIEWRRALAEMKNQAILKARDEKEAASNDEGRLQPSEDPCTIDIPIPESTHSIPCQRLTFHLHHPSLPSRRRVLIPLSPDDTLETSLTNRLVLEFPTIYVLHQEKGDKLSEGFISEEDYFAQEGKGAVEELEEGEIEVETGEDRGEGGGAMEEGEVDQKRLVEVLGKDLGGGIGVV